MNEEKIFSKQEEPTEKTVRKRKRKLPPEYNQVNEFVKWYEQEVTSKADKDVDFVEVGYRAYVRFFDILQADYTISKVIGHSISRFPERRMYTWFDEDGGWNGADYVGMAKIRKKFLENEAKLHMYGDYSLQELGMYGGGKRKENPYAHQYLSYAYYEKLYWDAVVKDMKEKILDLFQSK